MSLTIEYLKNKVIEKESEIKKLKKQLKFHKIAFENLSDVNKTTNKFLVNKGLWDEYEILLMDGKL